MKFSNELLKQYILDKNRQEIHIGNESFQVISIDNPTINVCYKNNYQYHFKLIMNEDEICPINQTDKNILVKFFDDN